MKARGLTLATSVLVILPQDVHAATLDGAAMKLPFALPFAGLLLSIALGPLLFPKLWRAAGRRNPGTSVSAVDLPAGRACSQAALSAVWMPESLSAATWRTQR